MNVARVKNMKLGSHSLTFVIINSVSNFVSGKTTDSDPDSFYYKLLEYARAKVAMRGVFNMESTVRLDAVQSLGKCVWEWGGAERVGRLLSQTHLRFDKGGGEEFHRDVLGGYIPRPNLSTPHEPR